MKHTDWYKDAIIYQIYPRSFFDTNGDGYGDINGIIAKLDYLKELGINCIWLSPIYDSPQEDNGYDISNYKDIYPPFGRMEDAKRMIEEMHKRDIRVIMDLVVNHTSSEHPWFKSAISDKNSPYRDYYIIKKGKRNGRKPPTNWSGFFSGSTWEKIGDSDEYYLHLFAKGQPDLNWENPKVREEVKSILRYWLDLGVDGFRCDVINLISKRQEYKSNLPKIALTGKKNFINGPRLHEYLKELYEDVFINYDCMTVGETVMTNMDDVINLTKKDNHELDMVFNFECIDADSLMGVKYFPRKFTLKRWKKINEKWQLGLFNKSWNTLFIENHDQRRSVGRFNTDENEYRNESAKSLALTYFMMQGTPFIYQGQEIGMANPHFKDISQFKDVEIHNIYQLREKMKFLKLIIPEERIFEYSRDNARTPMLWDDSELGGFSKTSSWIEVNKDKRYNVASALKDKNSIYYFYQSLIEIRKQYPVFKNGKFSLLNKKDKEVFVYKREDEKEEIVVISSFSKEKLTRKYINDYSNYELLLSNHLDNDKEILQPYECRLYYKKK